MARSRASARAAGARFNSDMAAYLARELDDDRVLVAPSWGAKDRGDITGVRAHGQRVAIECKNEARVNLAGWMNEAEIERGNDDALAGIVMHKRHGKGDPADQWVTMTAREFVALLSGARPGGE